MDVLALFLSGFQEFSFGHIALVIYLYVIMDERGCRMLKKLPVLVFSPALASLIHLSLYNVFKVSGLVLYVVISVANVLMCTLWVRWGWRIRIGRALAAVCMAGVFQMAASVLSARLFSLPAADEDLQFARQQLYEQELEAIRREARAFRHDYKNILAGLSAQAGAGELDALLTSLADLDAGFDRRVGEKIRMSTQIGNLRIPQVRGILLSKMAAMGEKGVDCRLEAIYPVERLGMCWLLRR